MGDRTNFSSVSISAGYVQQLITANDVGVSGVTGPDTTTIVNTANAQATALEVGQSSVAISDGSVNFNIKSHDGTNGLKLGSNLVTALAAQLNYNDTTTLGKVEASKSVVAQESGQVLFADSNATTNRLDFGTSNDMLMYHNGTDSYITNKTGILKLATETSGIAVTIGHTTSEVTIGENLNTTGFTRVNKTTDATSTTDGSLQTDGGLSVVKDCVFGDDVFLLSDSAVLNMGAGNDFTITHDGTTGATLAGNPITITSGGAATWSTSAGALTVDSAASTLTLDGHTGVTIQSSNSGDITLDSIADVVIDGAGGNIEFKDGGVLQLTLDMDGGSGVQILKLGVDTDDLVFQQYDGSEVCRMADDRRLYFYDKGGEYISGDGTDLILASGNAVNIASTSSSAPNRVIMTDTSVSHGITDVTPTSSYGDIGMIHSSYGGLYIQGLSDQDSAGARSLALRGICNDTHTDTVPTVEIIGAKRSGTGVQALASAETVLQVANHSTTLMTVLGSGSIGVGTSTPDTTLEVVGSFAANGPSSTFVTMGSGDTSPDVSGGNIFKSHSTGVTIDQFDGGVCGQVITIISGGATVYDVTSSELKGGTTNVTTAAGDVTMWVCESATVWHLLSWMDLSIDLSSGGF